MVRDGERCMRRAVHDSTGGGRARLWLEEGRSKPFLSRRRRRVAVPHLQGFGALMAMSQSPPGPSSRFPCVTAPNRRTRVMVASQAYLSWATFLEEENRECHVELQFVFVVVGPVEKYLMTPEH